MYGVGVLILIYEDVTGPCRQLLADVREILEDMVHVHQDIVEVHCTGGLGLLDVEFVYFRHPLTAVFDVQMPTFHVEGIVLRRTEVVLRKGDESPDVMGAVTLERLFPRVLLVRREAFEFLLVVPVGAVEDLSDACPETTLRVPLVINGEILREAYPFVIDTEELDEDRMEGADGKTFHKVSDHLLYTVAHFPCGLLCEGKRKDILRRHPVGEQERDSGSQYAGLAGSRSGNDEHGAVSLPDSFFLLFVEVIEDIFAHCNFPCS